MKLIIVLAALISASAFGQSRIFRETGIARCGDLELVQVQIQTIINGEGVMWNDEFQVKKGNRRVQANLVVAEDIDSFIFNMDEEGQMIERSVEMTEASANNTVYMLAGARCVKL